MKAQAKRKKKNQGMKHVTEEIKDTKAKNENEGTSKAKNLQLAASVVAVTIFTML